MTFEQDLSALFKKLQPARALPPLSFVENIATSVVIPGHSSPIFATPNSGSQMPNGAPNIPDVAQDQHLPHFFGPAHQNAFSPTVPFARPVSGMQQMSGMAPGVHVIVSTDAPLLPGTIAPIGTGLVVLGNPGAGPGGGMMATVVRTDIMGVYPWPCGRDVVRADFNARMTQAAAIIAGNVPLLDGHGAYASSIACSEIIQTLQISPGKGLAALKAEKAAYGPASAIGNRLDALIECGESLLDFQPFVSSFSTMLGDLTETGDVPSEDPCFVAMGKLKGNVANDPGKVGAQLAQMANGVVPSNATSRRLLSELNSIAASLSFFNAIPRNVLGLNRNEAVQAVTDRILKFYGTIINASFCECPEPGGGKPV